MQNAYIERNNGSIRRELLNTFLFDSLAEVRIMTEEWRHDYNHDRPHKALGYLSPVKYAEQRSEDEINELKLYPQTATGRILIN